MNSLREMKAAIRLVLSQNPNLETESERRHAIKEACPFKISSVSYQDWQRAVTAVLTEKPSAKLIRPLESIPEHLRDWAAKNNLIK